MAAGHTAAARVVRMLAHGGWLTLPADIGAACATPEWALALRKGRLGSHRERAWTDWHRWAQLPPPPGDPASARRRPNECRAICLSGPLPATIGAAKGHVGPCQGGLLATQPPRGAQPGKHSAGRAYKPARTRERQRRNGVPESAIKAGSTCLNARRMLAKPAAGPVFRRSLKRLPWVAPSRRLARMSRGPHSLQVKGY